MINAPSILFTYDKGSFISRAIYWFMRWFGKTRTPKMSHTALYVGGGEIIDILSGGVTRRRLSDYQNKRFFIHIGTLENKYMKKFNSKLAINYAVGKIGARYANRQIVAIVLKKLLGLHKIGDWDKDGVICSELICDAYSAGGIHLIEGKHEHAEITPIDIFNSPKIIKERIET